MLLACIAALGMSMAGPARAMTPEQEKAVATGLDALYRCDYEGAEGLFARGISEHPGDPVYSLGYAAALWWRMENDLAGPDSPQEHAFYKAVGLAIDDAKRERRSGRKAEGYLYLGAARGLKARREASQHRWVAAYVDGRRSYRDERKAIELDPGLYDAYLGLGAYDYYVATLSRLVRVLTFTSGGNKAKGLSELRLAAEHGQYSRTAAKLLLVGIYWTLEKNPREAWNILQELRGGLPESPLIDSMRLIGLYHLRDAAGLKIEAAAMLAKAESGKPFYRRIDRAGALYFLGLAEQLSGGYTRALEHYEAALRDIPEGHPLRGLVELFVGESLDLLGRRDDAVAAYHRALKEPPLWGVPRYARHLISHPYAKSLDPLPPRSVDLGGTSSLEASGSL